MGVEVTASATQGCLAFRRQMRQRRTTRVVLIGCATVLLAASLSTCAEGGEGKNETQRMKGRRRRMGEKVTMRREAGSYQDKKKKKNRKSNPQNEHWREDRKSLFF